MVLPLIGILAAGAAAYAHPHAKNRNQRIQGEYQSGALEGVDRSDPAGVRDALFDAGILSGQETQADIRAQHENIANRQNAIQRAQISAGPGYMNARLNQQKYADTKARTERTTATYLDMGMPESYAGTYLEDQWVAKNSVNNPEIKYAGMPADERALAEQNAVLDQLAQQAQSNAIIGAPRAAQIAAEQEFTDVNQPLVDDITTLEAILPRFDEADLSGLGSNWLDSPENAKMAEAYNRQIFAQRMKYQKEVYGDNEPPTNIQDQIAQMFPMITSTTIAEGNTRAVIKSNMQRYLTNLRNEQARNVERFGVTNNAPAPALTPSVTAQGWTPSGGSR